MAAAACSAAVPPPLGLNNRALGGSELNSYTPGVTGGVGLNNIGLLVRTWGAVTYIDTGQRFFYIDDGSHLKDGTLHSDWLTPNVGVRVSYAGLAEGNTIDPPSQTGLRYAITGISSTTAIPVGQGTSIIRTLRPRRQTDLTQL